MKSEWSLGSSHGNNKNVSNIERNPQKSCRSAPPGSASALRHHTNSFEISDHDSITRNGAGTLTSSEGPGLHASTAYDQTSRARRPHSQQEHPRDTSWHQHHVSEAALFTSSMQLFLGVVLRRNNSTKTNLDYLRPTYVSLRSLLRAYCAYKINCNAQGWAFSTRESARLPAAFTPEVAGGQVSPKGFLSLESELTRPVLCSSRLRNGVNPRNMILCVSIYQGLQGSRSWAAPLWIVSLLPAGLPPRKQKVTVPYMACTVKHTKTQQIFGTLMKSPDTQEIPRNLNIQEFIWHHVKPQQKTIP